MRSLDFYKSSTTQGELIISRALWNSKKLKNRRISSYLFSGYILIEPPTSGVKRS